MENTKSVDIFVTAYLRQFYTEKTLSFLFSRTSHPFRLFLINNGGNDELIKAAGEKIFLAVNFNYNVGIHAAWNTALALAESEYFITSDNDIYVPQLQPDWLAQMVKLMDERPDYGAISLCPHVFIGAAGIDPEDPEDVKERNMCGAVMRIMRREAVIKAGGWEHTIRTGRNHEESTICSRLQSIGYKTGIATRIRAFHPFPSNWGYPESFTPEMQKHNPDLKDYVTSFGNMDNYNHETWMPK
jgi:GT2 family glycosyltransferase